MQPVAPGSTYRLQLHKEFTFDHAGAVADYLRDLGVTHVYSSPYLQAAPGSQHGYDVVDHRLVNEELGGAAGHVRFCKRLDEVGLGQILDIVPNHMSLAEQNRYWWDVLENGHGSRYAAYFDIDWNSFEPRLRGKVLVPVLSDHYGRVLSAGGIKLNRTGSSFAVESGDHHLPLSPQSLGTVLGRANSSLHDDTLGFLSSSYCRMATPDISDRRAILALYREKNVLCQFLDRLCSTHPNACKAIDRAIKEINADPNALDAVLDQQNYRLAFWKTADQQLGYRRFFNVNTLVGLRVEREFVFDETHALIVQWLEHGILDGVRVDHPDGLRDPREYFRRLRNRAPHAWVVGEKILEGEEPLREDWPIQGTTGYDFLNLVLGLLVQPEGVARLGEHYTAFTGDAASFEEVAHGAKVDVTAESLASDVNRLTSLFVDICEAHREQRDYTRKDIRDAIGELAACFPVYRTYVLLDSVTKADRTYIAEAVEAAKSRRPDLESALFDFIECVLTNQVEGSSEPEFVARFQQFTGPVMAKGVEDCTFYRYNRFLALNEVGGDPASCGVSIETFHRREADIQAHWPTTMVALGTHDTKRGDDVRARLAVLSELPDDYAEAVARWSRMTAPHREPTIDRGTEWFLYQTLVGAWPIDSERLTQYMQKAMREAKLKTTWVANNAAYEEALNNYIAAILADSSFTSDVATFVQQIEDAAHFNSLTQTLLKYTVPGVPDLYQGSELWDRSLVDPDNRRPVDYEIRRSLLAEMKQLSAVEVMHRSAEGLPKLWTIHRCLQLRRDHAEWFGDEATYKPMLATGSAAGRIVSFLRSDSVIAVAPRWSYRQAGWGDTALTLPAGDWLNVMTDGPVAAGSIRIDDLLRSFPIALLVRRSSQEAL